MVFCRNCGGDLPSDDSSYCPVCGKPQNTATAVTMAAQTKKVGSAIALALVAGFIGFNGIGHLYIGKIRKGVIVLVIGWIILGITFLFIPFGLIYLIFWIWQAYDVRNKSKYYNEYILKNGKTPW